MHGGRAMEAERVMQSKFSIPGLVGGLLVLAAITGFYNWLFWLPNREELGWRTARVEFTPVALDAPGFSPLKLVGAWKLTSDDPRFGGLSALAIDRGHLPGTTNLRRADADNPLNLIGPAGLCQQPRVVVNNAFGFGGINAALVLAAV